MQDNHENKIVPSGQCHVSSFGQVLNHFSYSPTEWRISYRMIHTVHVNIRCICCCSNYGIEMALESQNIPAYRLWTGTFGVKRKVSFRVIKIHTTEKSTPRPGIEPGPPG